MAQYCSLEEAFSNYVPIQRKNKIKQKETFESENISSKKTYSSQKSDYDYMCKTAGICVYPDKFENGDASHSSSPSPQQEALKKCTPLPPPVYEYPFTDEDKRRFRQALKIALEEMESGTTTSSSPAAASAQQYTPRPVQNINVDMGNVDGYNIDEELESYMMVNDMKSAIHHVPIDPVKNIPLPGLEKNNQTAAPLVSDKNEQNSLAPSPSPSPSQQPQQQLYTKKNKIWFELLLFSIGGILIILLLEELFKLAQASGLKKAVLLFEKIYKDVSADKAGGMV